jgi:hypothetical protein
LPGSSFLFATRARFCILDEGLGGGAIRRAAHSHMRELRHHPRVTLQVSAWCESDRWTLRASIVDVSEGGVRVRGCPPQPAGSRLKISFRDAQGAAVVATTEVVWSADGKRPENGLRLVEVHEGEPVFAELIAAHRR